MKDLSSITKKSKPAPGITQSIVKDGAFHRKLSGFAKVLAGGRVVTLDHSKDFGERFLGMVSPKENPSVAVTPEQAMLETIVANLEAGMKLVEKQEFSLAKFGGRLADIALALNKARETPEHSAIAQDDFEHSRDCLRSIAKETFDHTALFSNGPSKPITIAIPAKMHWEGLSIDRCDLSKPGFLAIDRGKVCPRATGLLLDRESIQRAFEEWRSLCVNNLMQSQLINSALKSFLGKLRDFIGGRRWLAPPFPECSSNGPLRRPHLEN